MTKIEKDILDALLELDSSVAAMKTADPKPNLIPLFARLNGFSSRLPRDTHAPLIHYLSHGSYEKARRWLLGRNAETVRGRCGGSTPPRD